MLPKETGLQAVRVGVPGSLLLDPGFEFRVMGVTSRGIFLEQSPRGMLFLTSDPYAGPYTVNVPGLEVVAEREALVGRTAHTLPGWLAIPALRLSIGLSAVQIWQPDPFPCDHDAGFKVDGIRDWAAAHLPSDALLNQVFRSSSEGVDRTVESLLDELRSAVRSEEVERFQAAARPFLGRGTGLTPSGDDFLAGLFLALARYPLFRPVLQRLRPGWEMILDHARHGTTLLSALLLQAACLGYADERVISGLDAALTAEAGLEAITAPLAGYGSSSGYDSLAGLVFLASCTSR